MEDKGGLGADHVVENERGVWRGACVRVEGGVE